MVTAMVAVILMRSTSLKGATPPFIMELPAYHAPQLRNLVMLLWDKAKHFIHKAFTIILASTIVIWVISHFDFGWNYLSDEQMEQSILGGLGQLIQPLFTPLGFGSQLGKMGWVFAVAAITGLIAKENVVSTLGTLAACLVGAIVDIEADGGVGAVNVMIVNTGITLPALLSFIAFNMTTIPCFAAVATTKAELGKKTFANTLIFWIVASYCVSTMVYTVGTWLWTAFIWLLVIVLTFVIIRIINKKVKV
jgi:ferrous iron transport protein B